MCTGFRSGFIVNWNKDDWFKKLPLVWKGMPFSCILLYGPLSFWSLVFLLLQNLKRIPAKRESVWSFDLQRSFRRIRKSCKYHSLNSLFDFTSDRMQVYCAFDNFCAFDPKKDFNWRNSIGPDQPQPTLTLSCLLHQKKTMWGQSFQGRQ